MQACFRFQACSLLLQGFLAGKLHNVATCRLLRPTSQQVRSADFGTMLLNKAEQELLCNSRRDIVGAGQPLEGEHLRAGQVRGHQLSL